MITCIKPHLPVIPTNTPLATRNNKKLLQEVGQFSVVHLDVLVNTCAIQYSGKSEEFALPV